MQLLALKYQNKLCLNKWNCYFKFRRPLKCHFHRCILLIGEALYKIFKVDMIFSVRLVGKEESSAYIVSSTHICTLNCHKNRTCIYCLINRYLQIKLPKFSEPKNTFSHQDQAIRKLLPTRCKSRLRGKLLLKKLMEMFGYVNVFLFILHMWL